MPKAARPTLRFVDRLVLVVAWLVTCGLVYVLGFYLGRGTQDHQVAFEERAVRLPVTSTPPPEGQHPKEAREFPSFYETLPGGTAPKPDTRQAAVTTTTSVAPTTTRAPAVATSTLPRTSTTTATRALPTTTLPARPTPPAPPGPPPAPGPPPPPAAGPPPTMARPPIPRGGGGSWSVEAAPTRSRAEAEQLLATLRRRGYDAEMVSVQRDGDTWYRLRVGRYATAEQANEVMRRLRDVEGVSHAFVASE
jgi:cell division septation protein DedD